jgi:C-terminal processing protease CtpA/Prc
VENLLESEVEPRPLRFSVGDPRADQPDEAKKKQIERWIKELGDEEYDVREAAEASLEKEGPVVLPFVRKALDDPDIQIRETAARLVRKLAESKKEMVTYLGISMNLMQQGEGVQIMNVMEKTSAREYGLQVGDVILKMDGTTIPGESYDTRMNWLRKQIQSRRPGDKIKLTVKRGDEEKEFEIPLGEVSKEVVGEN